MAGGGFSWWDGLLRGDDRECMLTMTSDHALFGSCINAKIAGLF
jgi:hypothetical protein